MNLFDKEQALLVGIEFPKDHEFPLKESMLELAQLAETAGAEIVGEITQKRDRPDKKFFIGTGKVEELKALIAKTSANLIVFDSNLSPSQDRNLGEALEIKVIDRTELILDIFAKHARSREGKLQVELAQSSFLLPRLTGHGITMSRLGGGIATRGPGETNLEYDRRRIRKKISALKNEIEKLRRDRSLRREKRRKSQVPIIALVGYTNSGKSTLLNSLSGSEVLTQDQLFATLDPTIRKIYLPSKREILITDTVGFIQKLPHQLVAAFAATLEEVTEADLLLHVADVSNPFLEDQIQAVYRILEKLKAASKPIITVFNKADRLQKTVPKNLLTKYGPAVVVSALYKKGLDKLEEEIARSLLLPPPQPF